MKELNNDDVYDFLQREIACHVPLEEQFGGNLKNREFDHDFWEELSEHLDCFRICKICGEPMIVGYCIDGANTYCSDECLRHDYTVEEFEALYNNGEGNSYYTTWYEDSISYNLNVSNQ